jgi:signal transduction histidine kinase
MSEVPITPQKPAAKWRQSYFRYLVVVAAVGWSLAVWGMQDLRTSETGIAFALFLLLSIIAHIGTVRIEMPNSNINYTVAPAVSMAVMFLNGIWIAAIVENVSMIAMWLIKSRDPKRWRKSLEQLAFNAGMGSVVIVAAGGVFWGIRQLVDGESLIVMGAAWLLAAVVFDQLNLWLVIGIIKLQNPAVVAHQLWRDHWWASALNNAVLAVGGGVLAYAGFEFGWSGILVFFLPVLLSAFAFRLYASQIQKYMTHLEEVVAERTTDLSTANAALLQRDIEKNAFLAVLAHDMKSPLTSIRLYGELLARFPARLQQKPEIATVILDSQETLTNIVENIVDLEKLDQAGSLALMCAPVDIVPLLNSTVEIVRIQGERKGMRVEMETTIPFLEMSIDSAQIQRAVMNLLSNAIKYSAENSQAILYLTHSDHYATITVCDSGYGIPEEDLPFIFDRYRRVGKHRQKASGTGLGLAITKAIVMAHGGTISVASREYEGSTFTIVLPLIKNLSNRRDPTLSLPLSELDS